PFTQQQSSDRPDSPAAHVGMIRCQDELGLGSATMLVGVVPFISQIAGVPSLFCQTMSALRSPLTSSAPMMCHEGPGLGSATPLVGVVPFISQIAGVPSLFCHSRSLIPSPLKSATGGAKPIWVPPWPSAVTENTGLTIATVNEICAKAIPPSSSFS